MRVGLRTYRISASMAIARTLSRANPSLEPNGGAVDELSRANAFTGCLHQRTSETFAYEVQTRCPTASISTVKTAPM